MIIQLRYAHQGDFIYIFEDAISDIHIDYGVDRTMVCFDYNDKILKANEDDFCFTIVINKKKTQLFYRERLFLVFIQVFLMILQELHTFGTWYKK